MNTYVLAPENFPPNHVEALREVDLLLSVGTHGCLKLDDDHGHINPGATTNSYKRADALVDKLRRDGGMLTVEEIGFDKP